MSAEYFYTLNSYDPNPVYMMHEEGFAKFKVLPRATIHDQDKALEDLLKTVSRECEECDGLGMRLKVDTNLSCDQSIYIWERATMLLKDDKVIGMQDCFRCSGLGQVCAWCHRGIDVCDCGEGEG